jgi:lysophospholipase L1-like esterase
MINLTVLCAFTPNEWSLLPMNADIDAIKRYIQTTSEPATFMFTGDDITFAAGQAGGYRNYMQHFEERIRWELTVGTGTAGDIRRQNFVFNTDMKGASATEVLADFPRLASKFAPKTVFVMLGMGDAALQTPIDEFKTSLRYVVSEIRSGGAAPVLQTPIFPKDLEFLAEITPYIEAVKSVSFEESVVLADHFGMWQTYPNLSAMLGPDDVLPNELGHLQLAKDLMTLFDIGGSGETWRIDGFTDIDKPFEQYEGEDLVVKSADIPVELAPLVQGIKPVTWLFSGDSITHGALHTKGFKSFVELFGERVRGVTDADHPARAKDLVLNTGVSGTTTRDLLVNFDRWVAANHPDVVLIAFGMNDSSNKLVPIGEFESNLRTVVDKVRTLGAIPILQTINTIKPADTGRYGNLPDYIDKIRKVALDEHALLVDHFQYWTEVEKGGEEILRANG